MGEAVRSGYCKACGERVRVTKPRPNHVLHLLLTILTAGMWIVVWLLLSLSLGGWRCDRCGRKPRALSVR